MKNKEEAVWIKIKNEKTVCDYIEHYSGAESVLIELESLFDEMSEEKLDWEISEIIKDLDHFISKVEGVSIDEVDVTTFVIFDDVCSRCVHNEELGEIIYGLEDVDEGELYFNFDGSIRDYYLETSPYISYTFEIKGRAWITECEEEEYAKFVISGNGNAVLKVDYSEKFEMDGEIEKKFETILNYPKFECVEICNSEE